MRAYHFGQALVLAAGFLLGALLAIAIAPGDILLCLLAGGVLSIFCREHLMRACGNDLALWSRK